MKDLRKTDINVIGAVPWGTHLCQFYSSKNDLLEILVPYFMAGLRNNEFCMWITSDPLTVEDARSALIKAMPDFESFERKGQIEILPHADWYLRGGFFDLKRVFDDWMGKLNNALKAGYDGMRVTGNTGWLERKDWHSFTEYEEMLNAVVGDYSILVICTYSLDKCTAADVIDVVRNHKYALIRREDHWDLIESAEKGQLEKAERATKERFRTVFDESPIGIELYDASGRLVDINQACLDIFGVASKCGVAGSNLFEDPNLTKEIKEKLRKGESARYEGEFDFEKIKAIGLYHTSRSGVIYLNVVITPIDVEREIRGFLVQIQDVTAGKIAEDALRAKSESALAEAQRMARIGSWELDLASNRLNCSDEMHRIFGLSPSDNLDYAVAMDIVHPEDRKRVEDTIPLHMKEKAPYVVEFRLLLSNGTVKAVVSRGRPERNERGEVKKLIGTLQDVTESKRLEEALRLALAYNRSLIEASIDPLVTISPEGKITDVNESTEKATGCQRAELIGKDFSDYFTEPDKAKAGYRQVLRDGFVRDYELAIRHKDGSVTPVLYNATIYRDEQGATIGVFAAARDITERKQAEDELNKTMKELERSNRDLEHFAYIASHDLQEPLRMVSSFMGLLEKNYKGKLDADADTYIKFAADGAKRMSELVSGLLEYSRVSTKAGAFEPTSCEQVLKDVLQNLSVVIRESGARIDAGPLPVVNADRIQMVQVFQNLIENAIKFRKQDASPVIAISAAESALGHEFLVKDNGIGIDAKYAQKVFQVFQRVHGSKYSGTGIGLAVCKRIIERHGGAIWFESVPGQGTAFHFTIPKRRN